MKEIASYSSHLGKHESSVMSFREVDWEEACMTIEKSGVTAVQIGPADLSFQIWAVIAQGATEHYLIDQGRAFVIEMR